MATEHFLVLVVIAFFLILGLILRNAITYGTVFLIAISVGIGTFIFNPSAGWELSFYIADGAMGLLGMIGLIIATVNGKLI